MNFDGKFRNYICLIPIDTRLDIGTYIHCAGYFLPERKIYNLQCVKNYAYVKNNESRSNLKHCNLKECDGVSKVDERQIYFHLFMVIFPSAYHFLNSANVIALFLHF